MPDVTIGLGAAIASLREEILKAIGEGDGKAMRFRLSTVDLSLQVVATSEGEGKIGWKILGLGGSYERSTTQTLNLKLEPVWRQTDGSYTSDFVIADQSEQTASFGPRNLSHVLGNGWGDHAGDCRGKLDGQCAVLARNPS